MIRDRNGHAEWVNVKKGPMDGDLVEVIGPLHPGDKVVRRASDEIREGSPIQGKWALWGHCQVKLLDDTIGIVGRV